MSSKIFLFYIFFVLIFLHNGKLFSQSAPLSTDRARVNIVSIPDPFGGTNLKVLQTDKNTPLRAGTSWVWSKGIENLEPYYATMAKYGLNSVRIILFDTWKKDHYLPSAVFTPTDWNDPVFRTAQLARIDRAVNWASANGMYAIINSHNDVGKYDEAYSNALWSYVAPYFANRTHVIYELSNEPMAGIGPNGNMDMAGGVITSPRLKELARTYNIARDAAPNTMLMILSPTGISDWGYGTGMGNVVDAFAILANRGATGHFDSSKTAVSFHLYHDDGGATAGYNAGNIRNLLSRYAAWPSENNFAADVSSASLNITDDYRSQSYVTKFGTDAYVSQTCERLGMGWCMWNMEGDLLTHNWPIYWADALSKGWTWTKDADYTQSTSDVKDMENLKIYPNPTSNKLYISNIKPLSAISIYSVDGKILYKQLSINIGTLSIDIHGFKNGIYFVNVKEGNTSITKKFGVLYSE